jgi:hypothetical protein
MSGFPMDEQVAQMTKELTKARIENWRGTDLFTWQWWLIIASFLIPWIVFYYIGDRKQLPKLLLYGTLLMLLIITLDLSGFELGLWYYPFKLLPLGPLSAYIDVSPLPIIYMLEYQYFPRWKDFVKVSIVTGFVFSFCFEPILAVLGLYTPVRWEHYYGLPFYILMPIMMRLAVEKIFFIAKKQS